jgi:hypothetical protein
MPPKQGSSTGEAKNKPAKKTEAETPQVKAEPNSTTQSNKLSKDEKELFIKCLKADQRVRFSSSSSSGKKKEIEKELMEKLPSCGNYHHHRL